jgi:Transposase DDE domain
MGQRKDAREPVSPVVNGTMLRQALAWIVDAGIFDQLSFHGNTKWQPVDLVVLAVMWVWSDQSTLTAAFAEAVRWAVSLFGDAAIQSYQGLTGALVTWTGQLLPLLWERLHQRMEECGQGHWRVGPWLALAVDGSRVSTPRTVANEKAFCAPRYGQGKTAKYRKKKRRGQRRRHRKPEPVKPQIWTTLLWHMGLRLPWSWKNGPSNSSERDHFRQMLRDQRFPAYTLFCADAGFIGYELWRALVESGHSFLIRVGANVTLLRQLGYVREHDGVVYCWPDQAAKKKLPPLVLRLWQVQVGRCQMSVVTNVLDEAQLSVDQARELYQLRWGIELQFRTLKQTFGRRKLRSKTPERALVELDWSLMGLTMIQLFAVKEGLAVGEPPQHRSVALAIGIIREMLDRRAERCQPGADLNTRLQAATTADYKRTGTKKARYRPAYKDKPSAGAPTIIKAQRKHKTFLKEYLAPAA